MDSLETGGGIGTCFVCSVDQPALAVPPGTEHPPSEGMGIV